MIDQKRDFPSRRSWLRFGLKTLLLAMLLVSAYYAGRAPLLHRVQKAERERDMANRLAQQLLQAQAEQLRRVVVAGGNTPSDERWSIEAGMMLDALEHQNR